MKQLEQKVLKWANNRNLIEGTTAEKQCLKLISEAGELCDAILKHDSPGTIDGIGDCLVVLINLSNKLGLDLKVCLEHAYEQIKDRKGKMVNGTFIKE